MVREIDTCLGCRAKIMCLGKIRSYIYIYIYTHALLINLWTSMWHPWPQAHTHTYTTHTHTRHTKHTHTHTPLIQVFHCFGLFWVVWCCMRAEIHESTCAWEPATPKAQFPPAVPLTVFWEPACSPRFLHLVLQLCLAICKLMDPNSFNFSGSWCCSYCWNPLFFSTTKLL